MTTMIYTHVLNKGGAVLKARWILLFNLIRPSFDICLDSVTFTGCDIRQDFLSAWNYD